MENPWKIQTIYQLQYFNCPSCHFKNDSKQEIINHAYKTHPEGLNILLANIKDESLSDCLIPFQAMKTLITPKKDLLKGVIDSTIGDLNDSINVNKKPRKYDLRGQKPVAPVDKLEQDCAVRIPENEKKKADEFALLHDIIKEIPKKKKKVDEFSRFSGKMEPFVRIHSNLSSLSGDSDHMDDMDVEPTTEQTDQTEQTEQAEQSEHTIIAIADASNTETKVLVPFQDIKNLFGESTGKNNETEPIKIDISNADNTIVELIEEPAVKENYDIGNRKSKIFPKSEILDPLEKMALNKSITIFQNGQKINENCKCEFCAAKFPNEHEYKDHLKTVHHCDATFDKTDFVQSEYERFAQLASTPKPKQKPIMKCEF